MRILRIRLANYRGIADREIEFPREGVTVIEGPNETGKSSLAEALDLVFDELDTTAKKKWKAVRPVDRDAGTEVEVDVATGPYRFTLFKRFFKRSETRLAIHAPRAENEIGREAHQRVQSILEETLRDLHLWRSLRVRQGLGVTQPEELLAAGSLKQALDRSTGGSQPTDREEGLFERVKEQYAIYFTERGAEKKTLRELREREEEAGSELAGLEAQHEAMQRDVARAEELERDRARLKEQAEEAEANAERRAKELAGIEALANEVSRLELQHNAARLRESAARSAQHNRKALKEAAKQAARERADLEARAAASEPELQQLNARREEAKARCEAAERRVRAAEELFRLRDDDVKYRDGELNLDRFRERRDRIDAALKRAAAAEETLARTRVDDATVKELEKLGAALDRAEAQLEAGSPRLTIEALAELAVEIDGERTALEPGKTIERTVAESATLEAPDLLRLRVEAGTSIDRLVEACELAKRKRDALLRDAGANDIPHARELNERRKEALRVADESKRRVAEELRDLDYGTLVEKLERTRSRVEQYLRERPPEPPIAPDFDAAAAAKTDARNARDEAQQGADEARAALDVVERAWQEKREEQADARTRIGMAAKAEEKAAAALEAARAEADDEQRERDLKVAVEEERAAGKALAASQQELASKQPERLRELASNARHAAERLADQRRRVRTEQTEVAARLGLLGEQGLFDKVEEARTRQQAAQRELERQARRAAAARLLFETMRDARDAAQRSYAGPLREKIVELGRLVFGASFSVELDKELSVATRTLDGTTLPFSSLSIGAQEQIGLLARVACALIVDEEEGVPLIFDDTLGHADPERLEGMGAMLAKAGQRCQIVLLTCTPERFRHVGQAHVVRLAAVS